MIENKPVNLPFTPPNLVEEYNPTYNPQEIPSGDYMSRFNSMLKEVNPTQPKRLGLIPSSEIDLSGRYPQFFPGRDNEEMYAQSQGSLEKMYNGVAKFAGITGSTFLNGTVGLVYGAYKAILQDRKFSSLYDNEFSNRLNEFNKSLEQNYAHYKTLREREGSWWEPANLFTGNFLWDNIIKNLGFSVGTIAGGFGWGAALKAIGLSARLTSLGVKGAASVEGAMLSATNVPKIQRLGTINKGLEQAWNTSKTIGGKGLLKTDRFIIATTGTAGEAGIEALNNSQHFREKLIEEFKAEKGYHPNAEEMKEINAYAESVGNSTYGLNVGILMVTNFIQLPKIVGSSFKNERKIINDIAFDGKKYASSLPQKGFGKALYKAKNIASLFFNPVEAFEEGSQFVIEAGTQNYFNKKYKDHPASAIDDGLLYGVKDLLTSDEGWLNITIGGLSGAIMTGPRSLMNRGFTGYGGKNQKNREQAISALNKSLIRDKLKEAYSNLKAAEIIQSEREAALRRGDILESKDLEFDYAHTFITSRLKYEAKDAIDFEINSLKEQAATEEGFALLQEEGIAPSTDTRQSFVERLDNLKRHADYSAKMYDAISLKYKGLVNKQTGEKIYSDRAIDALVYASSKVYNYDTRIRQLSSELSDVGVNVQSFINNIFLSETFLADTKLEENVLEALTEIKNLDSLNEDSLIESLRDIVEIALRRRNFLQEYKDILASPLKIQDPPSVSETAASETAASEKIIIKTKKGEIEVDTNEEYYLGNVTEYDKNGKEVYRFPKLTILGENEDGTLNIKDADGNITAVPKEKLEDYNLGKVSSLEKDKKGKYFFDHINTVFEFNFGKGDKKPGRLRYSPKDGILNFVYKDDRNKIRTIEVTREQFVAQKGFKDPMIKEIGKLSSVQNQSKEAFVKAEDARTALKNAKRLEVLNQLFNEIFERKEKTDNLLSQKKTELENLQKDLTELEKKIARSEFTPKKGRLKATFKRALASAMRLSRLQEQLKEEVISLELEKEELEINLTYIQDMSENLDVLPSDSKEFIEEIENQTIDLEILIEETAKEIVTVNNLLDKVAEVLDSAINFVLDTISEFKKRYPNVPTLIGQEWIDFLKANPNFLKKKPEYRKELKVLEDMVAQIEDTDIVPNERSLQELKEKLSELQSTLENAAKELTAKELILNKFKGVLESYNKEKENQEFIKNNIDLKRRLLGTAYTGVATEPSLEKGKPYEADSKKTDLQVVTSTIVPSKSSQPHHVRANLFGANFHKLSNKENIRGTLVTSKTESQLGLTGLTEFLKTNSDLSEEDKAKIDTSTTVVMVFTDVVTNKPVDVDGNTIEEVDENIFNTAVFQVMPMPSLTWSKDYGSKSMFRESTSQETIDYLTQEYQKKNKKVLESDVPIVHRISPSFGILTYVMVEKNGKEERDTSAKTSVAQADFISNNDLKNQKVLEVSTKQDSTIVGDKTYNTPLGRVFLKAINSLIPLSNRTFNQKESEVIFQAIYNLAIEVFESKTTTELENIDGVNITEVESGNLQSDKSKRILKWLKNTIYWGNPRNAKGYSSVFFSEDLSTLEIGRDVESIPFTPSSILENKGKIINILQNMYNNVNNNTLTKEDLWNSPYEEIFEITPKGEIKSRIWINYQTYLLSDKIMLIDENHPDNNKKRNNDTLPLFTNASPINDIVQTNRKNIYFTITDSADDWNIPVKKTVNVKPSKKEDISADSEYDLSPGVKNIYVSPSGKKIAFEATPEAAKDISKLRILKGEDLDEVLQKLTTQLGSKEKAQENTKKIIQLSISNFLSSETIDSEEVISGDGMSMSFEEEGDETVSEKVNINIPSITLISATELEKAKSSEEMETIQNEQSEIVKKEKELQDIINCLWKS